VQDYESLPLSVMINAILVNTQTDRQFLTGYTNSSASWLKFFDRHFASPVVSVNVSGGTRKCFSPNCCELSSR